MSSLSITIFFFFLFFSLPKKVHTCPLFFSFFKFGPFVSDCLYFSFMKWYSHDMGSYSNNVGALGHVLLCHTPIKLVLAFKDSLSILLWVMWSRGSHQKVSRLCCILKVYCFNFVVNIVGASNSLNIVTFTPQSLFVISTDLTNLRY
jgi:hypothetical protein